MDLKILLFIFIMVSSLFALNICSDVEYWTTHPSFDFINISGVEYYIYNGGNISHPTCLSNGNIFGKALSGSRKVDYFAKSSSLSPSTTYTPNTYEYILNQSVANNTILFTMDASTNHALDITLNNGTDSFLKAKPSISNVAMCIRTLNISGNQYVCASYCYTGEGCLLVSDKINITLNLYITNSATKISKNILYDNSIVQKSRSLECDISFPCVNFNSQTNTSGLILGFWNNYNNNYTGYIQKSLNNSNVFTDSILGVSSVNNFYVKSGGNTYINYQAKETINNPYNAYLLYGSTLIIPKYSIYLSDMSIYYERFNATDFRTMLYGNVATIVQDSNGICYFAPPYTPSNYSLTYSISVYQTPCLSAEGGGGYEGIITFPLLPNHINCGTDGTQYLSNITYDTDVLFEKYITYKNASVVYNSSLASSLFSNITITNETSIIDIKVNNRTRCYWNDETSVLGFELPFNEITNQLIGIPLLIVAVGLSMVNPFVFVFVFVVNDMFSLISIEMIFFLAIATGIMSFVANWNGERNFKVLIILFLLASAYLVQVSTLAPTIAGAELVELNILIEAIETLFSGISTGENLANIIVSILPTFLLNFIILVLKLPAILISIIFASLEAISPLAVAPLRYFEGALIVGAYVFIMLKAYEMGRNMFKSV